MGYIGVETFTPFTVPRADRGLIIKMIITIQDRVARTIIQHHYKISLWDNIAVFHRTMGRRSDSGVCGVGSRCSCR